MKHSRTARPRQALARLPGPKMPSREFISSVCRMGPLTSIRMAGELVDEAAMLT